MFTPTQQLAQFAANTRFDDIPTSVIERCEELFLDTLGSIYAGSTERPVQTILSFAQQQGPQQGTAQYLPSGDATSPYLLPWLTQPLRLLDIS